MQTLEAQLQGLEPGLVKVLHAIADGVQGVAETLRTASVLETGTSNALGDKQLVADVEADGRIMDALRRCGAVETASSEEQPLDLPLGGSGYSVAYDPLDGSSIIGANWAVGSIFGVWPGSGFVGRTGRDQVAAAYAVHGPRTVLVVARPVADAASPAAANNTAASQRGEQPRLVVQEFVLHGGGWALARGDIRIAEAKAVFGPANLRAAVESAEYAALVESWMAERYTLRYSGGMVPDVHHILAKGGGVFCNPASSEAPAKLRVLYECLPLAFVVEAAGGTSHDGRASALDRRLAAHDDRSPVCLGSRKEVTRCLPAMASSV